MQPTEATLPDEIGRYRIVRLLGQGAMGRVLLAHDPVLDRDVAIKLLRDDLSILPEQKQALVERMRQEARASARVSHPNIVALHDMGEDERLGLYLVFEYVEGTTLKERLGRGHVGPELAARLARELGDALTTAHAAGVLHRDIKPENVILARSGAKIADFGIARVPDSTLTRDGGLLGTPAYSAPESISGGNFSPLSDQFSMAATLWEAISGRRAFPGDDAIAVATRIATDEPPRIAAVCGLDSHVDTVLARALSKNPRSRFATCEDFGRALAEALELSPRTAMPTLPDQRHNEPELPHGNESRGLRIALGSAALGALVVFVAFQVVGRLGAMDVPAPPVPAALPPASSAPVAWLAERPAPHHAHHPSSTKMPAGDEIARDAGAADDGGDVDAMAAPVVHDAGDAVGRPDLPASMQTGADAGKTSRKKNQTGRSSSE